MFKSFNFRVEMIKVNPHEFKNCSEFRADARVDLTKINKQIFWCTHFVFMMHTTFVLKLWTILWHSKLTRSLFHIFLVYLDSLQFRSVFFSISQYLFKIRSIVLKFNVWTKADFEQIKNKGWYRYRGSYVSGIQFNENDPTLTLDSEVNCA